EGEIEVRGVLQPQRAAALGVFEHFELWEEAGMPAPTEEEIEAHGLERRFEDPFRATGRETIAPPVKALTVPTQEGRNTHEYRRMKPKRPAFAASHPYALEGPRSSSVAQRW